MAELLVIADDLTGALDSGVQLARKGQRVLVSLDCEHGIDHASQADVIVIDSESRHDDPRRAYEKCAHLVKKGMELGVKHVYKKTDSGLRGNVGAELTAVLEVSGASHLNFVPAYPKQQRTTENGIQYVAGVPLAQSIFSVDPLNPVSQSAVSDLIHEQSDVPVASWSENTQLEGILVFDCATDDDMRRIAEHLAQHDGDAPMAGCAGLLEMLPSHASDAASGEKSPALPKRLVVVSGSVNEITSMQLAEAERVGAYRRHLPIERILTNPWTEEEARAFVRETLEVGADSPVVLMDTLGYQLNVEQRSDSNSARKISDAASLCASLVSECRDHTVMIVGGDALAGFIDRVGATMLEPVDELFPGVVVARYEGGASEGTIVTKSGAFGDVSLFFDIHQKLKEKVEE